MLNIFTDFLQNFLQPDAKTALLVVLNLIVIESLLSVDNAAVLATMVMDLPPHQRKKALRIGLFLAYVFRGTALVFASQLIKIAWLKFAGGAYLIFLACHFFYKEIFKHEHILQIEKEELPKTVQHPKKFLGLNKFWSTVLMVEVMDMTFSIDNVFAAVAFTKNIYLICLGVFIGIITMRIVAGYFVKLMERFPFLDTVAFIIIGILGLRLCADFACTYFPTNSFCHLLHNEKTDFIFSVSTALIFFLPIVVALIAGKKKR